MAKSKSNGGRSNRFFRGDRASTAKNLYKNLSPAQKEEFRKGLSSSEQADLDRILKDDGDDSE